MKKVSFSAFRFLFLRLGACCCRVAVWTVRVEVVLSPSANYLGPILTSSGCLIFHCFQFTVHSVAWPVLSKYLFLLIALSPAFYNAHLSFLLFLKRISLFGPPSRPDQTSEKAVPGYPSHCCQFTSRLRPIPAIFFREK